MTRTEALYKLLKLGPLEKLKAFHISGWSLDQFDQALAEAVEVGLVKVVRGGNQHRTHLAATEN